MIETWRLLSLFSEVSSFQKSFESHCCLHDHSLNSQQGQLYIMDYHWLRSTYWAQFYEKLKLGKDRRRDWSDTDPSDPTEPSIIIRQDCQHWDLSKYKIRFSALIARERVAAWSFGMRNLIQYRVAEPDSSYEVSRSETRIRFLWENRKLGNPRQWQTFTFYGTGAKWIVP